jgi:hypothetical protein
MGAGNRTQGGEVEAYNGSEKPRHSIRRHSGKRMRGIQANSIQDVLSRTYVWTTGRTSIEEIRRPVSPDGTEGYLRRVHIALQSTPAYFCHTDEGSSKAADSPRKNVS